VKRSAAAVAATARAAAARRPRDSQFRDRLILPNALSQVSRVLPPKPKLSPGAGAFVAPEDPDEEEARELERQRRARAVGRL